MSTEAKPVRQKLPGGEYVDYNAARWAAQERIFTDREMAAINARGHFPKDERELKAWLVEADRGLPSEGEIGICGSILKAPPTIITARQLQASDFIDPHCSAFFAVASDFHRRGLPLDPLALAGELATKRPFTSKADVAEFFAELDEKVVTSAHAGYYVRLVSESSRKRRLLTLGEQVCDAARNGHTSSTIINDLLADVEVFRRDLEQDSISTERMFEKWAAGVIERERPALFDVAPPHSHLNSFPVGEGIVSLIGAPPGWGKTLLVMQMIFDALELPGQEHLRAMVANVEMSPQALLDRQLARLTGIGYSHIQDRTFDPSAGPRIEAGIARLRALMPRVKFLSPPFVLERFAEAAVSHEANICVLDYAQRFDTAAGAADQRVKANAVMDFARSIASEGRAVIVVSALNRPQTKNGRYEAASMGLASFRESSELEYGADCAYLLIRENKDDPATVLKCCKNRSREEKDIHLRFDGRNMQFLDAPLGQEWEP